MTNTERRDIYQEVTDAILAALEKGAAPWVRPWDVAGTGLVSVPTNISTRRAYQGVNVLLLWCSADAKGYKSSEWGTYRQIQAMGGNVRRGEKSTLVTFWKQWTVTDRDATTGEKTTKRIPLLRSFCVFNREQCEGLPAVEAAPVVPMTENERNAAVEAFVKATGADVRESEREGRAFYAPTGDYVGMPAIGRFKDSGAYYGTLLHEMTHWTGHASRCARDFSGRFGDDAYAFEELVAEIGSAFLCAEHRIDGTLQHPEYVAHWIKVLKGDRKAIIHAAAKAREAAGFLRGERKTDGEAAEAAESPETEAAAVAS
jgi:antirestriction protein ArdC